MENTSCYYGGSMKGVFRKGDLLRLRAVHFGALQAGDIIVFDPPRRGKAIVHRIIEVRRRDGCVITQGDNTPCPDEPVTADMNPRLVVGFRRGAREFKQNGGFIGMTQFRFHRIVWRLRRLVGKMVALFGGKAPLGIFRIFLPKLEKHCFVDREMLFSGRRLVAVRSCENPNWQPLSPWGTLFYQADWLRVHYPPRERADSSCS